MTPPGLRAQGVSRRYGGVWALRGVSLEVPTGARHALIGPNGAGKSTLLRVLAGEERPDAGQVTLGGRPLGRRGGASGVARAFQTSSLFPEYSVLDNAVLAVMAARPGRRDLWRPWSAHTGARRLALAGLERVGLAARAGALAGSLAHGERRLLDLALALLGEPELLLLDEPLAGLAPGAREGVAALLLGLERGPAVVLVEHDLAFALRFADAVTVLRGGEVLLSGPPDTVRASEAVRAAYLGKVPQHSPAPPQPVPGAAPLLSAHHLCAGHAGTFTLRGVSLEVRPGEVLAVLGRNGAGKTTLLHTLMGLQPTLGGTLSLGGADLSLLSTEARAAAGLALVPQGRRLFAGLSVAEELRLGARPGPWTPERAMALFAPLRERAHSPSTALSGGEQQMLAIARALVQNPRVLLLDEPTEGLSPAATATLRGALLELCGQGVAVVLAEQQLQVALSLATRVLVLERGEAAYVGPAGKFAADGERMQALLGVQ